MWRIATTVLILTVSSSLAAVFTVPAGDVAALVTAITTANGNGEADVIDLAAGATYSLTAANNNPSLGANGLPSITTAITINGHGAIIERSAGAATAFRHFLIDGGGHLTLVDLTLRNGSTIDGRDGGSIFVATGTFTTTGCTIMDNHCGDVCLGGAIHMHTAESVVDLTDTVLSNNSAAEGGAIDVFFPGTLTLTRTRVIDNTVTHPVSLVDGGGIAATAQATITILDSTISGNEAIGPNALVGALGGGISDQGGATWHIERTTISDNLVMATVNDASGGGIYEGGTANFTILNSTISGNHAMTLENDMFDACAGAGIEAEGGGTWVLNNVTITDNTVTATMGATPRGAGIGIIDVDTMTISNSIIAGNTGAPGSPDCFTLNVETLTSGGHLLVQDTTGCSITGGSGDLLGSNPMLASLADNGGPTFTHALLAGSPALESGDPAAPGSGGTACELLDQRGLCRPGGAQCDIGAVEEGGFACSTTTTLTTSTTTTTIEGVIDAFILPKRVAYTPDAADPGRTRLLAAGIFDTGAQTADLGSAATLRIGDLEVSVPGLERVGTKFLLKTDSLLFQVRPARTGSSKAIFRMKARGLLGTGIDPNAPLTLRFTNADVDGTGVVRLNDGRYKLRSVPGALIAPNLYLFRVKASLTDGASDKLAMRVGLATDGTTPAAAPEVEIAFGDVFRATIPSSAFTREGDRFVSRGTKGGAPSVTLDFRRELLRVIASGVELGTFADGAVPLVVTVRLDSAVRGNAVRAVKRGRSLKY